MKRIYGPLFDDGIWRKKYNHKLHNLLGGIDLHGPKRALQENSANKCRTLEKLRSTTLAMD
ncbi:hypothetical protein C0J52_09661 [Blattella germanica]|nr:hypothetical protein C0J52_09661 [Blattella germanica]